MDWLAKNWIWIAIAVGVLLMFRHHGGWGMHRPNQHGEASGGPDAESDRKERLRDPVSGEQVDPASVINSTYQGRTYYFGSRENRDKFEAAPAQYAAASPTGSDTHRRHRHGC